LVLFFLRSVEYKRIATICTGVGYTDTLEWLVNGAGQATSPLAARSVEDCGITLCKDGCAMVGHWAIMPEMTTLTTSGST
jgi:hypothetical protein